MRRRYQGIPLAPDDQGWHLSRQVEAVAGVDTLTRDVDHRAERVQERLAAVLAAQRQVAVPDLLRQGRRPHPDPAQPSGATGDHSAEFGPAAKREDVFSSWKSEGTQQDRDLGSQSPAADQDQALGPVRELIRELHRDTATQRMAHHRGPVDPQRNHQVADTTGVRAQRVVAAQLGRGAMPEEVWGHHGEPLGEARNDLAPGPGAAGDAVDQHQRGPAGGSVIADFVAMDLYPLELHLAASLAGRWVPAC